MYRDPKARSQAKNLKICFEFSYCAETWPGLAPLSLPYKVALASIVVSKWDALCSAKGIVISTSLSLSLLSFVAPITPTPPTSSPPLASAIRRYLEIALHLHSSDGEKNLSTRFRHSRRRELEGLEQASRTLLRWSSKVLVCSKQSMFNCSCSRQRHFLSPDPKQE